MVGVVIAILLIATFVLFWPETNNQSIETDLSNMDSNLNDKNFDEAEILLKTNNDPEEDKTKLMQTAYDVLEGERKALKRQLAKTKHLMWGLTFPPEQAKEMNAIMLNAHKFEKTPRMLGAFHDVKEIQIETEKVKYAIQSLKELQALADSNQ